MSKDIDVKQRRVADYPVDDLFLTRWSPRAMSGEEISGGELMSLFEAARWAPSEYNAQPWRFVYARRNTKQWDTLFDLLVDFNKQWCRNAAALIVLISRKTFEHNGKPSRTHAFNTGAAWENLALQGAVSGLVVHGMAGFNYSKAAVILGIPDDHEIMAMCAVGRPGTLDDLPEDFREKEKPSGRKKVSELAFEGTFRA